MWGKIQDKYEISACTYKFIGVILFYSRRHYSPTAAAGVDPDPDPSPRAAATAPHPAPGGPRPAPAGVHGTPHREQPATTDPGGTSPAGAAVGVPGPRGASLGVTGGTAITAASCYATAHRTTGRYTVYSFEFARS